MVLGLAGLNENKMTQPSLGLTGAEFGKKKHVDISRNNIIHFKYDIILLDQHICQILGIPQFHLNRTPTAPTIKVKSK